MPQNLLPFSFFTDGGTYNDDTKYFINNIFSRSGVCYSSKTPKNTNVQLYMGRRLDYDATKMQPKDHKLKGEMNVICLPYEKFLTESTEAETFKVLGDLVIHNQGSGYTCFVSSYCFFISDREVKVSKSSIVKFFDEINTREKFEALGLPIKKETKCPDGTANVAFEIDLSKTRQLQTALKTKIFDCLPVLWVFSQPSYTEWTVRFEQRLACKFAVLKLIDS